METYQQHSDVKLFCTTIRSFPESIQESFNEMEKLLTREGRTFYGISRPFKGKIVYKVGVTEKFDGEGMQYGFENFVITKGKYLIETINNWRLKMDSFAPTFQKLLSDPRLDHNFPCVEWYKSDCEVVCMVRLNNDQDQ